jgi:hypothetical protein
MTQRLAKLIKDWEMKNAVNVYTLQKAKQGEAVRPNTAYSIAIALGCTEDEAKSVAAEIVSSQSEDKKAAV